MNEVTEFEQGRITTLKKEIIQDYERSSQAKKIFDIEITQREDPNFIKVYYRPLIDRIWFSDSGHYPAYGSLGGTIARGEVDYLLSKLRTAVEISTIMESDFTMNWLSSVIALLAPMQNKISLIGSVENIYQKIIKQHDKWKASYDNVINGFKIVVDGLDIPLHAVNKEIVGNKIVILNRDCCRVKYREFRYLDIERALETSSTLFVDIKPYDKNPEQMDILIHSTIKYDLHNRDLVGMFQLESAIGEPLII